MFLFSTCQVGAETVFKKEVLRLFPSFRLSFSRPGFLTFKAPEQTPEQTMDAVFQFVNRSVFARTAALSIGKVQQEKSESTEDFTAIADKIWEIAEQNRVFVNRIHVFRRDLLPPGVNGFEPTGQTPELQILYNILVERSPKPKFLGTNHHNSQQQALPEETVMSVVEVDPGNYFVGIHTISAESPIQSYYPGGILPLEIPDNAVSRAWLKFEEGIRWAGFPIVEGDCCLDIGASPGGGSQVLLARGATVLGVDPAAIDPVVLNHPQFTHLQNRISQTKRMLYRNVRWLIADMNVAPNYTLEVLEELANRKEIPLCGMLFTLKLFQWQLADHLPSYAERLRCWGFNDVRIKQLAFNRQEVMVAASRQLSVAGSQ
ncbi:MAG: hypothetical protein LBQ50_07755 [Planctomycetaceae bacterium]|jgi:23S rRNA (cytidine2498-2'-O)-methyltransferase|nr:hypothetical protein [Planctomycetaceae bacterium]